ncbi:MAG: Hsp20 family protein [Bacteroidetes bacterium]|jgi:HSP20 family protein|nr:Hsp20/alpha crystallin family protein [Phycisphaerae bacterium]NBB73828.1 Hsp20 family protein [Bacteroidota bacterium]
MTVKDLTQKAKELIPWNWGKRPVRVQDNRSRRDGSLPALRDDFHRLFDDMFEDFLGRRFGEGLLAPFGEPGSLLDTGWPRVDLEETDDAFKVTAEVPGMEADDVEVTVGDSSLTIRGSKTTEREEKKKDYHLMETYSGSFHRTVPLPVEVNADGVEAHCKNGQLTVTVPKTEAGRKAAKRIEVK